MECRRAFPLSLSLFDTTTQASSNERHETRAQHKATKRRRSFCVVVLLASWYFVCGLSQSDDEEEEEEERRKERQKVKTFLSHFMWRFLIRVNFETKKNSYDDSRSFGMGVSVCARVKRDFYVFFVVVLVRVQP